MRNRRRDCVDEFMDHDPTLSPACVCTCERPIAAASQLEYRRAPNKIEPRTPAALPSEPAVSDLLGLGARARACTHTHGRTRKCIGGGDVLRYQAIMAIPNRCRSLAPAPMISSSISTQTNKQKGALPAFGWGACARAAHRRKASGAPSANDM